MAEGESVAIIFLALFASFFWKPAWGSLQAENPMSGESSLSSSLSLSSQTLLTFYSQTNGPSWKINTNWTTPDVCTWYGVGCSSSGDIISLSLADNNLTGKLGVELAEIQTLQKIDLSGNSLQSPIPYTYGSFPLLTYLDLSSNYFFDLFPPEFSSLTKLSFLNLSHNFLSDELPSPFFANAKSLTHFDVHDNEFSGEIPSELGAITTLQYLDLSENHFQGAILSLLGEKPNLVLVSLRSNSFTESFPIDFSDESKSLLSVLDISQNYFWGELPALRLRSLAIFNAEDNDFVSQLSDFSALPNLQMLDLSRNSLEGEIPPSLYGLVHLLSLDLSQNLFSGPISSDINNLAHLKTLSLGENRFSGNFPDLTSLHNLTILQLQHNHLSGSIPGSSSTPALTKLDLSRNKFRGFFPETLCNLEFLEELDLSSNQLSGAIPYPCFRSNLRDLDLSSNFLEDANWGMFYSGIQRLSLSSNAINLNWSACVSTVKSSLVKLDLDHNQLQGNVVEALSCFSRQFPFLSALNLAFNQLAYPQDLPLSFPTFSSLDILNLSANLIGGMVSERSSIYLNLGSFVNVDLSANPISGTLMLASKWNSLVSVDISFTSLTPCVDSSFFASHSLMSYRAFGLVCTDLPEELGFVVDPSIPWANEEITCPRWRFPNGGVLDVDGTYFNHLGCDCTQDNSYWNWTTQLCDPCPEGLMCSSAVSDPIHAVLPGYYPVTSNGTHETNQTNLVTAQLLVCNSPTLCNPRRTASFECAPGRDLDSLLCSKCDTDYYAAGDECWPCHSTYKWAVPIFCFVLMGFGLIFIWTSASKPGSPTVQIVVFWLQLTMILEHTNRLGPGISNTNPWTMIANFSWIQTITNLQPWAFECTFPTFDYVASFWIMLVTPAILLLIPMLTQFIFWVFSFCSPRLIAPLHYQTRIWFVSLFLINLFYFPVNQRFLEIFNCETDVGITYLVAAPWIKCDDSMYSQMRLGAILGLLFYLPLWPLWCTYQLLFKIDYVYESISENKVPLEDRSPEALQLHSLQFLWAGLDFTISKEEPQPLTDRVRYLWLVLGTGGRKFLLALILSLIPPGNIILPLLLLSTLSLTIAMNLVVKPYANVWHNYLEVALLAEVFFAFITGILGNTFDGPVDLIVYILHGITLFCILILTTRNLFHCLRTCQQKSKNEDDVVNVSDVFSDYLSIMTYKDTESRR